MKCIFEGFVRRALLSILIISFNLLGFGATYYLSPTGSDSNSGSITSPWFTLNKAWTVLKAGDIVYLRGGTYAFNTQQYLTGKNGSAGNLIQILAYAGETPVLTKSASYATNEGVHFCGNYFYWKGIEITGYTQIASGLCDGFRVENSSYNTFENLKIHGNGNGMQIANLGYDLHSTGNLVLNCDFYENQDPLTADKYGNADGLAIEWITHPEDVNTVRGCRFWWNTDDGIDLYHNEGTVIIEDCQSFFNGYIPNTFNTAGDGNGFKLGDDITDQRTVVKRIVKNCISVKNRMNGFTPNALYGIIELSNCTAYLNNNIGIHLADFNLAHVAKNCLSFGNTTNTSLSSSGTYVTNSWQNGVTFSTADFKSLDTNLLLASRQSDGSLPKNDFLQLVSSSKLIDKGTNIGIPYSGSAPDINSFEYTSASVVLPTGYNVTGGGSYCNGGTGVLVGLSGSEKGVNYQLQLNGVNSGSLVAGTGSALSFGNKTTAGTYTVVATNASTSASTSMAGNAIVTVNALPVVTFTSGVSSVSAGSTGNRYVTQSGMTNYKWSVSSGGVTTAGGTTATNAVTVTWNTSGTQYVTVNYANSNGCSALQAATYTVTVNTPSTGYIVTGGGSYCNGGTGVPVGLSGSQSGVTYQLQINGVNDGSAVSGNGSAISFGNKTVAGTYTVVAKSESTLLTSTMTGNVVVTVNPLPTVTFTTGVSTSNVGSTGNVYTTQSGMSNYKWTVSSGGSITSGGSNVSNSVVVTWNTSGSQSVAVSYTNANGCTAANAATYPVAVSTNATNVVNVAPTTYTVTGGGSFCAGGQGVQIGLNGSQVGVNYQLLLNGAKSGSAISGTGSAISFGYKTQTGSYTVAGTNATTLATGNMTGAAVVSLNPVYSINENITINQGEIYQGWTSSGQYTRTLTSKYGCDSIVTTNLTVVSALKTTTHTISLKKGNNLISSYLAPSSVDAGVIIKPLINSGAFYKMYDEDNRAIEYSTKSQSWTNSIGAYRPTDGYLVNVKSDCSLQISGTQVVLPFDIPLKTGWNIISYPRTDAVNAMSIVQPLINQNKLVKVQDESGNSIENLKSYGGWKNNIGNFVPGKAYKIYVSNDAILTIQSSYTKSSSILAATNSDIEHFFASYDGNGLNHMNINLVGLNNLNSGISEGDELAAFDGNICVGAIKLTQEQISSGSISLISSYITNDEIIDGFTDGHPIKLMMWKQSTDTESQLSPDVISGEFIYAENGSVLAELKGSITTGVDFINGSFKVDVYPNPCDGQFSVRLSDMPNPGSRIEISDVTGRILLTREISGTDENFNLSDVPTGMYLVRTIDGSSQTIKKLIVNK